MRWRGYFGIGLFLGGWILQTLLSYLWTASAPAPQGMLLAVLAVGALGKVDTAQSLGFFWGLLLDASGTSLFGSQGLILAVAGFAAGKLSKQVDAEKLSAQAILALGGTLFHLLALAQIELMFRRGGSVHMPGLGEMLLQALLNVAAAPVVFTVVQIWARYAPSSEGTRVFRP